MRPIAARVGVKVAHPAPAKLDRDHPPLAGVAFGHRLEIARVAGQAGDAQDRRLVPRPLIIAVVESNPLGAVPEPIGPTRHYASPACIPPLSRSDGRAARS